jgi:hypothetical protein
MATHAASTFRRGSASCLLGHLRVLPEELRPGHCAAGDAVPVALAGADKGHKNEVVMGRGRCGGLVAWRSLACMHPGRERGPAGARQGCGTPLDSVIQKRSNGRFADVKKHNPQMRARDGRVPRIDVP